MRFHWTARIIITGIAIGFLAGGGTATAQNRGKTAYQWWLNPDVQQALSLSGDQVSEITGLNSDLGVRADEASNARRDAWLMLKTAAAENSSGEEFETATEAYRKASDDLAMLSVERLQKLTKILSPDQFAALGETAPAALAPKIGVGVGGGIRSLATATSDK